MRLCHLMMTCYKCKILFLQWFLLTRIERVWGVYKSGIFKIAAHFFFFLSLSITRIPSKPPRWMVLLAGRFFISFLYIYSGLFRAIQYHQYTLIPCVDCCNRIYSKDKQFLAYIVHYHIQNPDDIQNSGVFCLVSRLVYSQASV